MSSLQQLGAVVATMGKKIVQLDMPPEAVGRASSVPFFISQKDVCEIVTGTDLLCISILQLWLL